MKSYAQALRGDKKVALKPKAPVTEHQEASSSSIDTKVGPTVATGEGEIIEAKDAEMPSPSFDVIDGKMAVVSSERETSSPIGDEGKGKGIATEEAEVSYSSSSSSSFDDIKGTTNGTNTEGETSTLLDSKGQGIAADETKISFFDDAKGKAVATETTEFEIAPSSSLKDEFLATTSSSEHVDADTMFVVTSEKAETKPSICQDEPSATRAHVVDAAQVIDEETQTKQSKNTDSTLETDQI